MTKPLRIALAGLGVVGTGLMRLIHENHQLLSQRSGRAWEIVAVCAKHREKPRPDLELHPGAKWVNKPKDLLLEKPDVIVELIGGAGDPAVALVRTSLKQGIPVVTANKALIAEHAFELAHLAENNQSVLRFEAAVAGAIPIVKILKESLAANRISSLTGILNSTCNYILSQMSKEGLSFEEAVQQAQKHGYAEADPTLDIQGIDSAHKLAILATIAFGIRCPMETISFRGITQISSEDIKAAQALGYDIKLIAHARLTNAKKARIHATVSPMLVPVDSNMATTVYTQNAVEIEGNFSGPIFIEGYGAGAEATASSVAADISGIARGRLGPPFGIPFAQIASPGSGCLHLKEEWYLRLIVLNQTGVLAAVSGVLAKHEISIHTAQQISPEDQSLPVNLILKLHPTLQEKMTVVLRELEALPTVTSPISSMPIYAHSK